MQQTIVQDRPAGAAPNRVTGWVARVRPRGVDLYAPAAYLVLAVWTYARLWRDPAGRLPALNPDDFQLFQWMLAHSARVLTHFENPFLSDRIGGGPNAMNTMANTSIMGLGVPLTPVTLIFGPAVSFLLIATLALAGTATGWYLLFSRHLVSSRPAAAVGAFVAGFSPAMLSQASGHPQIAFQVLIPVICWRVLLLTRTTRPVRDGIILGLIVTYQAFIGEEVLLLTAIGCAVVLAAYAVQRPRAVLALRRGFAPGLGVAAGVAVVLLAVPLSMQFLGPQHYSYIPSIPDLFPADILSYFHYTGLTLGGDPDHLAAIMTGHYTGHRLMPNATEANTFFGVPLLVVLAGFAVWLWRSLPARVAVLSAAALGLFSLGIRLTWNDHVTRVPGVWAVAAKLPVLRSVVPTRFGLLVAVAAGALVALGLHRALTAGFGRRAAITRWGVVAAVAVALVPLLPRPTAITTAPPVPGFLASDAWRAYVDDAHTVLVVPPTSDTDATAMAWAAQARLGFRLADGYYLLPDRTESDGRTRWGPPLTPTESLFVTTSVGTGPVAVSASQRTAARRDLADRRIGLVLVPMSLPPGPRERVRALAEQLFGPGTAVDGAWIWDVR
jgi:hypothetical protein